MNIKKVVRNVAAKLFDVYVHFCRSLQILFTNYYFNISVSSSFQSDWNINLVSVLGHLEVALNCILNYNSEFCKNTDTQDSSLCGQKWVQIKYVAHTHKDTHTLHMMHLME